MDINYFPSTSLLMVVLLCFSISFAKRNVFFSKRRTNYFVSASLTNIVLLLLQSSDLLLEPSDSQYVWLLRIVINCLGFTLSPLIPYFLYMLNCKCTKKRKALLNIPLIVNTLLCLVSTKTGIIFSIDSTNQYTRGSFFLIPLLVSSFYWLALLYVIPKTSQNKFNKHEKSFLFYLSAVIMVSVSIQIFASEIILIWHATGASLILYYIFLHELYSKYDPLTGILNRAAYEKELEMIQNSRNVAFVLFDLNELKQINDSLGHAVGDLAIINAAKSINYSFRHLGDSYRIGGDEFVTICDNANEKMIESALIRLNKTLAKIQTTQSISISLASGYSFYKKNSLVSIYTILKQADTAMYQSKAQSKLNKI